jgi:hypothetical protein
MKSRDKLIAALDRIRVGKSFKKYKALKLENIYLEAGLSRATLYRNKDVIERFEEIKKEQRDDSQNVVSEELFSSFIPEIDVVKVSLELRRQLKSGKDEHRNNMNVARQEIYILNKIVENRDRLISNLRREISDLKGKESSIVKIIK